jgi:hypothetical protein
LFHANRQPVGTQGRAGHIDADPLLGIVMPILVLALLAVCHVLHGELRCQDLDHLP